MVPAQPPVIYAHIYMRAVAEVQFHMTAVSYQCTSKHSRRVQGGAPLLGANASRVAGLPASAELSGAAGSPVVVSLAGPGASEGALSGVVEGAMPGAIIGATIGIVASQAGAMADAQSAATPHVSATIADSA